MVAELHKIAERFDGNDRVRDKARLTCSAFQAIPTDELAGGFELLARSDLAGDVAAEALVALRSLFTATDAPGVAMAVRAAGTTTDGETIRASMMLLSRDRLAAIDARVDLR